MCDGACYPAQTGAKALRLHEAAARIVEFEPFLNINEVRKRLSELVASGDLPAQSEIEDPGNDLAWSFGWRRAGLLGRTFAETLHLWLEKGATIEWESNAIFVPIAGRRVRIPLPRVEWDDVLRLFTAPDLSVNSPATPAAKEVWSGKTAPDSALKSW